MVPSWEIEAVKGSDQVMTAKKMVVTCWPNSVMVTTKQTMCKPTWSQTTRRSLATNRTGAFSTGESRFLLTSQVILSMWAVPYQMELHPYPIDSYRLVDAYGLVFIA